MLILPHCIRDYSSMERQLANLPATNPIIASNYNISNHEQFAKILDQMWTGTNDDKEMAIQFRNTIMGPKEDIYSKYQNIESIFISGFNAGIKSSEGYSTYTKSGMINGYDYTQHITLIRSAMLLLGETVGIRWEISWIEWARYKNYSRSGTINTPDQLIEMLTRRINLSKMINGSEQDKTLALDILNNQLEDANRN